MADVAQLPGVWAQIRLVAGLRWRILRNGLRQKNSRWDMVGIVIASVFGALFVLGLCFAFFFGGYQSMASGHEGWIALPLWAIFLFWQLFPIFSAGFGASFEFKNLLRFPLDLRTFYIIDLAYGLADFSAIASVVWLGAMTAGATAARADVLPALLIVCPLFALMNIVLERTVGSWLERILARRKARELFFALFVLLAVSVQFVSPVLQRYGRTAQPYLGKLVAYLAAFPPSLAGKAIASAALGNYQRLLLSAGAVCLYLLFFAFLLWLRLANQYRGEELSETAAPAKGRARSVSKAGGESFALRLLSPQVAAVLRKEFRYLTRNSFAFFLLIMPPAFVLLFTTQFSGRHPTALKHPISSEMFFPGMMAYLLLILMGPAYNSFAFDGKGIQTYFTSPLSFREVFLGKNILLVCIVAFELTLCAAAFSYFAGLPSWPVVLATAAAMVFVVSGQLSVANWSSLCFPRKLNFGQMRGQRQSGMAALVGFGAQIILGSIGAPVLFLSRWTGDRWLPAEVFAFLSALTITGYVSALGPLAQLAEKKKDTLIEALCR